jgi:adenylate cyclase
MSFEIERKFLVINQSFKDYASRHFKIIQGFISDDPERMVRVRWSEDKSFLTIKGAPDPSGTTRFEWEEAIPPEEAKKLLDLCLPGLIEKTRYIVDYKNQRFEVDEFHGQNQGLILAELEIYNPDVAIRTPDWLGSEVTGISKYYNVELHKNPFSSWK